MVEVMSKKPNVNKKLMTSISFDHYLSETGSSSHIIFCVTLGGEIKTFPDMVMVGEIRVFHQNVYPSAVSDIIFQ